MNDSTNRERRSTQLAALAVFVWALAVYGHTLRMGFVNDDANTILSNYALHSLGNLPQLFGMGMWPSGSSIEFTYRPLFLVAMALDYALWGDNPFGYHLASILVHALNAVLVFLVLRQILRRTLPALLPALVFAVHPAHAEAVTWVSARCGLLAALFILGAFYLYLRYREAGRPSLLAGSLLLYLLAVFAKEEAIVFPAIILSSECCLFCRPMLRRLGLSACYLAVAAFYFGVRSVVLKAFPADDLPPVERLLTGPGVVAQYFKLLVFPFGQKVFYDVPIQEHFLAAGVIGPLLLVLGVLGLWGLSLRFDRRVFFSFAWVFITLALFSGLVLFPRPALMASRYLYLPSVGFCLGLGLLLDRFLATGEGGRSRSARPTVLVTVGMIVAVFAVASWQRSFAWSDEIVFRRQFVKDAPNVPQAHNGLGVNYVRQGDYQKAEEEFRIALRLAPGYYDAHYNLGVTYLKLQQPDLAKRQFLRVLELNPYFADALDQLGQLYLKGYQVDQAIRYFEKAIKIDQNNPRYRENLRFAIAIKNGGRSRQ